MSKWDQAFRVFSDIYCKAHPNRSTELIQYSHVIHMTASGHVWYNLYAYDCDFRLHIGDNPQRSWSIILQQVWSLRLHDKIRPGRPGQRSSDKGNGKCSNQKDYCWMFKRADVCLGTGATMNTDAPTFINLGMEFIIAENLLQTKEKEKEKEKDVIAYRCRRQTMYSDPVQDI